MTPKGHAAKPAVERSDTPGAKSVLSSTLKGVPQGAVAFLTWGEIQVARERSTLLSVRKCPNPETYTLKSVSDANFGRLVSFNVATRCPLELVTGENHPPSLVGSELTSDPAPATQTLTSPRFELSAAQNYPAQSSTCSLISDHQSSSHRACSEPLLQSSPGPDHPGEKR